MRLSVRFSGLCVTFLIIIGLFGALFLSAYHARAATANTLSVTCTHTRITGSVDGTAPYVRVQITFASDLTQVIASKAVKVNRKGEYTISVSYDRQPRDTLLIVSMGDWDGEKYLAPTTLQSRECNPRGGHKPE